MARRAKQLYWFLVYFFAFWGCLSCLGIVGFITQWQNGRSQSLGPTHEPTRANEIIPLVATDTPFVSPTSRATATPQPTLTPRILSTSTEPPTSTPRPTFVRSPVPRLTTPAPIPTVRPVPWWVDVPTANLRACPSTDCAIVGTRNRGDLIQVINTQDGWHELQISDGDTAFISASLTRSMPPVPTEISNRGPTSQPLIVTQAPPPPAPPTGDCPSLGATCSQLSCAQAYACLTAGNNSLDRDHDGVPCESVCPGG